MTIWLPTHADQTPVPIGEDTIELTPERRGDIYLVYGKSTTIRFKGGAVRKVDVGAQDLYVHVDAAPNFSSVRIEPLVQEAETNMVVHMNDNLYEFILHIGTEQNVRTAVTAKLSSMEEWAPPAHVPAMRPDRIDIVDIMDRIEEAESNPDYLAKHADMVMLKSNRKWTWNNSGIIQRHTTYFRNMDLLVLKFELHNTTNGILYLHARQYRLRVGNQSIPVTIATQLSKTLYPGQIDQVFLFLQGYSISPGARFELQLPPDSASIRAVRKE